MKKFLFLLVGLVLLTGCGMKGGYDLVIKSDKTLDFSFFVAYDDEMIQALMLTQSGGEEVPTYSDDDIWNFLESMNGEAPEGYTMERYDQDGYRGFKYEATNIGNIDEVTGEGTPIDIIDMDSSTDDMIMFTKNGNNYVSNIVYSPISEAEGQEASIEIQFTVTLPTKPISHNATTVSDDGKTLTWNLNGTESGTIDFEFNFSSFPILMVSLIGGGILLLAIIIVIIIVKKSKIKKQNTYNNVTDNQPHPGLSEQPSMNQPQPGLSEQPSMNQPHPGLSEQPSMNQPYPGLSEQPSMNQPQPGLSEQPSMNQPQPGLSEQPSMNQPQPGLSEQPSMNQPESPRTFLNQQSSTPQTTIMSVDDLLKSTPSDNQNNQ